MHGIFEDLNIRPHGDPRSGLPKRSRSDMETRVIICGYRLANLLLPSVPSRINEPVAAQYPAIPAQELISRMADLLETRPHSRTLVVLTDFLEFLGDDSLSKLAARRLVLGMADAVQSFCTRNHTHGDNRRCSLAAWVLYATPEILEGYAAGDARRGRALRLEALGVSLLQLRHPSLHVIDMDWFNVLATSYGLPELFWERTHLPRQRLSIGLEQQLKEGVDWYLP